MTLVGVIEARKALNFKDWEHNLDKQPISIKTPWGCQVSTGGLINKMQVKLGLEACKSPNQMITANNVVPFARRACAVAA